MTTSRQEGSSSSPGAQVDPVRIEVRVAGGDRAALPRRVVVGPAGLETHDRRGRQRRLLAEELAERGLEVTCPEALEVEPREQALGLEGEIASARQEGRLERWGPCWQVRHPWWADLDRPGPDADLAGSAVAVAVAGLRSTGLVAVAAEEDVDLGLEGVGEHPPGALPGDCFEGVGNDRARRGSGLRSIVPCHRGVPPFRELTAHRKGTPCSHPVSLGMIT